MSTSVADDMIRAYFDRWQRLEEEKRTISDDLKELFAEARGNGLDTKALRAVFREQVGDKTARDEFDAICDLYRASLERPRAHPAHSARGIIEKFDAETGEITEQPETATQSDGYAIVAVKGSARFLANAAGVEPPLSDPHPNPLPTSPAADQPGAGDPLPPASGTLSPDPHLEGLTTGDPNPSSDAGGAKYDGAHSIVGQGGDKPDIRTAKSEQQDASAAQTGNEAGYASGATVTLSDEAVPAFLRGEAA